MDENLENTEKKETNLIEELDGLPQEYQVNITKDLLEHYTDVMGEENIHDILLAYSHKYKNADEKEKQRLLRSMDFDNKKIRNMEKLKKLLNEGEAYYNASTYGRIQKAGGTEAYIRQLEEENKHYKSLAEKHNDENEQNKKYYQNDTKQYNNTVDSFDDDIFGSVNEMKQFFKKNRR